MTQSENQFTDDPKKGFIALVADLAAISGPDGLTLREIRDRLDERGFGLMILILAIPCLVPALYGVPQIVGIPILLLAGQMLAGRIEPWLPEAALKRRVSKAWLDRMADFATKRMGWFEQLSRPRLTVFAEGWAERVVAIFMILATLTIVLPMTNTVPSVALTLLAVGVIQRDGLFVLGGAAVAVGWATALATVAIGFYFGAGWAVSLLARFGG
ncbi:exopolysaccharide biosynthesis protein [uncultured Brevundimonas sp.]|uniref:exopolysaccharide biosynthesis protein n=1 Tax=uncultured Brevundimonas sp. TaxID=213418 RepID=UPI00261C18F2|nr:exopolysaccharide biosynthesis protein [uncultured Brevundimonas sp.]HRJ64037.1 exopolysaccharide biosynthesis protein [Brevundimonas sp.]